jgi:hypothetical protein
MDGSQSPPLSADQRKELYDRLREVWGLGANVAIAWRAALGGIELVYLPTLALPMAAKHYAGLFDRARHVGDETQYRALMDAGCRTVLARLSFPVQEDVATVKQMEAILRHYTVTHSQCRAVALFDIVKFSLQSSFVKISFINVLSYYLNLAAARVEAAGLPIDLTMSTTGDGFYAWNRTDGLAADLALFYTAGLALAYNQFALMEARYDTLPDLRCCFDFGEHYEFYQASGTKPDARGYIVGDVTIGLARLISAALPKQFLVGNGAREVHLDASGDATRAHRINLPSFFAFARKNARLLVGSPLGDAEICAIDPQLTGETVSDREFSIRKYSVTDKHGMSHRCFNANFEVADSLGRRVLAGLAAGDLANFQAARVENEDIRIKFA